MTNEQTRQRGGRVVGTLVLGLVVVWLLVWGLGQAGASTPAGLSRTQDPLVMNGANFPAFDGVPLTELALYQYQAGAWQPIPFQVDEVDSSGAYVASEDGLLDANDELVLMPGDLGDSVAVDNWPTDAQARLYPRYAITATDSLQPGEAGWVYLYRSTTLPPSDEAYIAWDEAAQTLSGISYTVRFETEQFVGIADLSLNGQVVDVLDRQKIRGQYSILLFGQVISTSTFNEETVLNFITQPLTITLPVVGPVRAVASDGEQGFAFYGAKAGLGLSLPLADVDIAPFTVLHFDFVQVALDLLDPAGTGMAPAFYYDSNGANAAIDGVPEAVPASPPLAWSQVAGALGGWVNIGQIGPANGTLTNHYRDDATPDPNDTGDGRAYGEAGARIANPNGTVTFGQVLYLTPAGAGNAGAQYLLWSQNPLRGAAALQSFPAGNDTALTYLPFLHR